MAPKKDPKKARQDLLRAAAKLSAAELVDLFANYHKVNITPEPPELVLRREVLAAELQNRLRRLQDLEERAG